jgi:hypothetical protein
MKKQIFDAEEALLDFLYRFQSAIRGTLGMLLISFIIGKTVGLTTWPWWAVLSPFWIPLALGVFCWCLSEVVGNFKK